MIRPYFRTMLAAVVVSTGLGAQTPKLPAAPGSLVDVGGHRLHLLCAGRGAPTILLEAGASSFAIDWTLVQREIARTNRVCSYDRAGMGWSDSASMSLPARDLHTLLRTARERAPFVMVGASYGGLLVREYLADHPGDVLGLVLVDPASEDRLFTMVDGQAVTIASLSEEQVRARLPSQAVRVPRRRPQTGAPFDQLPLERYQQRILLDEQLIASIPEVVQPEMMAYARLREHALLARLAATRSASAHALGDRPTVVLSRGNERDAEREAVHLALARLSTNSRHSVVAGAGHEIHLFQPAAVITAIQDVVQAIRTKAPLPQR